MAEKIIMCPDFGWECFWFASDSSLCEIEEFEPYLMPDSKLYKNIKKWCHDFDKCEGDGFDWDAFDKIGKSLHKELQLLLKNKYILTYQESYEETSYRRNKQDV